MSKKRTCGPMYLEALLKYAGDDPVNVKLFAAGFISGQAEKVYLGACKAAMFRPSDINAPMVREICKDVAQRYGLMLLTYEDEFWLVRNIGARSVLWTAIECETNSADWHVLRGMLCGVPKDEIDPTFHEREGYGQPCDQLESIPEAKEKGD